MHMITSNKCRTCFAMFNDVTKHAMLCHKVSFRRIRMPRRQYKLQLLARYGSVGSISANIAVIHRSGIVNVNTTMVVVIRYVDS